MSKKVGILLVQMGGPCCIANVEDFLFNLFKDEHIIQLAFFLKPFQKLLAKTIARKRAPEVAKLYQKIGGSSPILYETQLQAKALADKLAQRKDGTVYKTFIAMRYSYPFLKDSLLDILDANLDELLVIPLYPQYSTATTESNFAECRELFAKSALDKKIPINYIQSWEDNEFFIQAWTERIEESITRNDVHILFSAHGLPEKYICKGDPYQKQVTRSVELIMAVIARKLLSDSEAADEAIQSTGNSGLLRFARNDIKLTHSIAYQSKVGPVKWLEPSTDNEIKRLAAAGVKNLIVVPISFVGDHIETTYEINMLYKDLALENGIENFVMARALKDDPLLIAALESLVR